MTAWQQWLDHPEQFWLRNVLFQVHFWIGAVVGAYLCVMTASGSLLIYRNELSTKFSVEWLVDLHKNLLAGSTGHVINGIGAICLTLLCVTGAMIWWPGTKHWRRPDGRLARAFPTPQLGPAQLDHVAFKRSRGACARPAPTRITRLVTDSNCRA